jgi:hypothetical protein
MRAWEWAGKVLCGRGKCCESLMVGAWVWVGKVRGKFEGMGVESAWKVRGYVGMGSAWKVRVV